MKPIIKSQKPRESRKLRARSQEAHHYWPLAIVYWLVALSLLTAGLGCAVYRPAPIQPAQITSSPWDQVLSACDSAPDKIACRNGVIVRSRLGIDAAYSSYEANLVTRGAVTATVADFLTIAVSAVSEVTGTAHLKSILASAVGAATGFRATYQKDFFSGLERTVLIQVMRRLRLQERTVLDAALRAGPDYTLANALDDLADYYDAGTALSAITSVLDSNAQQAGAARGTLRALRDSPRDSDSGSCVPATAEAARCGCGQASPLRSAPQ